MVNITWTCWKSGVTYVCRHFNVLKVESRLKVAASNIQLVDIKENSTEVYAHNISWLLLQQPSTPSNAWKQSFNSEPLFSTISRLCCMASLLAFSAVVWAKAFTSTTPWGEGSWTQGPGVHHSDAILAGPCLQSIALPQRTPILVGHPPCARHLPVASRQNLQCLQFYQTKKSMCDMSGIGRWVSWQL